LKKGDFVILDLGVLKDGYLSDMTRTVVIGRAGDRQRQIYQIVLDAQRKAIARVRDGVPAADVDRAARRLIERRGFGKAFGHGTGHGIGLEVHEWPALNAQSKDVLRAGMVVTIEPGIYIRGWGGVRIEDMVQVTRRGGNVLSRFPKRLLECPCT
jgi:Xaa-Pro aminopeptidase